MTVFAVLMVAEKDMSNPLASVSFKVSKLPTLASVKAVLSKFLIGSLNVNVIFESVAIDAVMTASIIIVGEIVSADVNVAEAEFIALL
jgi:hypothetical protein